MLTYGYMIHKILNKQNDNSSKKETFLKSRSIREISLDRYIICYIFSNYFNILCYYYRNGCL